MKTSTRLPVFALSLCVCSLLVCARAGARRVPAAQGGGAVVLAVSKYEATVTAEPVVIYRNGAYAAPPIDEEKGTNAFAKEYFKPGRKFRILSGGGEAGALSIIKYMEPGCVGLVAEATAETSARLGGRVKVLATDSQALGRGAPSRRAPTEAERARAVELARASYAKNGVGAALASKMEVVNLTATDLDRDGRSELVGSFLAGKNDVGSTSYTLFLIMEPAAGDAFKTAWEWFHKGSEDSYEDRHFVDQLDFDGDGVGEVIAMGGYYESNDYVIYKRQQGRWRPVYKGGGGGC
ncbi:MAG TPA: hypothetical protein VN282_00140 [Pyrinomonadaceae bacterium]|nr:hypothetical protein [Pyrinomonadaceae bacterium]